MSVEETATLDLEMFQLPVYPFVEISNSTVPN